MNRLFVRYLLAAVLFSSNSYGQTLFTYGTDSVKTSEFLRAFNKNNSGPSPNRQAYEDYLDMFVNFKLKVKEAYALGLDTLQSQKDEIHSFRDQIIDNYIKDDATLNIMIDEAIERGKKEIHLLHIYVKANRDSLKSGTDTANEKIRRIHESLLQGKDFASVAAAFSEAPSSATTKGDMGFITVFTLPYQVELAVYKLKKGEFTAPIRTASGYHIFKKHDERAAAGKIRVAQILIGTTPGIARDVLKKRADSVHLALQQGANFERLALEISDDNLSYRNGGILPPFGAGTYDANFERVAFQLRPNGEVSKPVETSHGFHILKRLPALPAPDGVIQQNLRDSVRQLVTSSDRIQVADRILADKLRQMTKLVEYNFDKRVFSTVTDSIIDGNAEVQSKLELFEINGQKFDVQNWKEFLNLQKGPIQSTPIDQLYARFVDASLLKYYRDHLEEFNIEFAEQMREFREGNLFFEIMQRKVWTPAATDSAAQLAYYNANKSNYRWKKSADAIIFAFSNRKLAEEKRAEFAKGNVRWRELADASATSILADSGRFEFSQIPGFQKPVANTLTKTIINSDDSSATYALLLRIYHKTEPRNFQQAKGLVINDYQQVLDKAWIESLRKKYPVSVNRELFRSIASRTK
jgi:peptidyl-prolyl cis-trans isomerase SurA